MAVSIQKEEIQTLIHAQRKEHSRERLLGVGGRIVCVYV